MQSRTQISKINPDLTNLAKMSKKQIFSDFFRQNNEGKKPGKETHFRLGIFIVELNELYHFKSNEQD